MKFSLQRARSLSSYAPFLSALCLPFLDLIRKIISFHLLSSAEHLPFCSLQHSFPNDVFHLFHSIHRISNHSTLLLITFISLMKYNAQHSQPNSIKIALQQQTSNKTGENFVNRFSRSFELLWLLVRDSNVSPEKYDGKTARRKSEKKRESIQCIISKR